MEEVGDADELDGREAAARGGELTTRRVVALVEPSIRVRVRVGVMARARARTRTRIRARLRIRAGPRVGAGPHSTSRPVACGCQCGGRSVHGPACTAPGILAWALRSVVRTCTLL